MLELNKIYCMDNVQGMKQIDNESVDLANKRLQETKTLFD